MKATLVGESTGFDVARLIEQHQAGVWRYLRVLGCDVATAEDLTQDTFVAVLQRPFEVYSRAATAAYLRRTAYNLFISMQRRGGKVTAVENVEDLAEAWGEWAGDDDGETLITALRECLTQLPDRVRQALDLRYRDRQSRAHIATALQMSEHGAKNLMQRAKRRLRECIEGKLR